MLKTTRKHHWHLHDGMSWQKDYIWDMAFPKYPLQDKKEGIAQYYDDYYKEAERLEKHYPGNFKIFMVEELNSDAGVANILDFIRVPKKDRNIVKNIRENTTLNPLKREHQ